MYITCAFNNTGFEISLCPDTFVLKNKQDKWQNSRQSKTE